MSTTDANGRPADAPITVACGAATDVGLRRGLNEDAFFAQAPLFLVADGMGGHQAGEVASAVVIDEFALLAGLAAVTADQARHAFERARRHVQQLHEEAGCGSAGTTLTGALITELDGSGYWLIVNVGDSRTYRLCGGVLEQITVDHSVVQELIERGELDRTEAGTDMRRNVITRAVGAGSDADADWWMIPAEAGDRLLVCSDGLHGEADDAIIDGILREQPDPQRAAEALVAAALAAGGRDNITAIVVDALRVRGSDILDDDVRSTRPARAGAAPSHDAFEADTLPGASRARRGGH